MDFCEFLMRGKLGSLEVGSNKSDIFKVLGEPSYSIPAKKLCPEIWAYGNTAIELFIQDDRLERLKIQWVDNYLELPKNISISNLPLNHEREMNKWLALLTDNNISYEVDEVMTDQFQQSYITSNKINLISGEDELLNPGKWYLSYVSTYNY